MDKKTFVLCAGGTGGHLFPAEALAEELLARGHRVIIFTDNRGSAFKSLGERVAVHEVRAATLKPGIFSKIDAIVDMSIGILTATVLLNRIGPAVIVGFGGYPSFPGVFSGQIFGIPTIIHEQNAVLGKANMRLAPRARKIALSLSGTKGVENYQAKTVAVGNPVRKNIVAVRNNPYTPPDKEIRILITGGSQGAQIFSAVVPAALEKLPSDMKSRLRIMHQCREENLSATAKKYAKAEIPAEVATFFTDMPERLASCHLFIGRSGASTVAEIAVTGRPAIFVPMKHADMQQKYNAEALSLKGGGWMTMQEEFTPAALAQMLQNLIQNPLELQQAAAAAKTCGQPDAAKKLADEVEETGKTRA